jgi:hypothetical protein
MRETTSQIQKELDETREHIKRGVLELPEETRQNADAMRRVVSDQIQALGALSEIITRHGKTLDLSSPALGEPRNVEARSVEPVAAAVGDGSAGWSGGDAPRPTPVRARAPANGGSREPRPAPARAADAPAARSAPVRPAASGGAAASAPANDEDERGWVSDLLRRASRDDEGSAEQAAQQNGAVAGAELLTDDGDNGPAPATGGALNLLAADIAKAIDHDASVELWERHKRGESNLFTRRLYTLQGQQTFDEIKRKYLRDKDFRSAVDRYIADFEKLLAEVNRNSKDQSAGNSYLTSDTGKVYTMLAHASGRFD